MEATSTFLHSKTTSFNFTQPKNLNFSARHFNKHLQPNLIITNFYNHQTLNLVQRSSLSSFHEHPFLSSSSRRRINWVFPLKCSFSNTSSSSVSATPLLNLIQNSSFDSLKSNLSLLTPIGVCKWVGALSIGIAVVKRIFNLVTNPFFWMYFSWTWMFWPWFVALSLAVYGVYCFRKHSNGEANLFEQISIVTASFTWLTLVPPAHFNGFLEGWPFVFFFVYHYFFFFNVSVRKRQYGDYHLRKHDPKWDITLPNLYKSLFCVGVIVAHWLAAFEGPELHLIPGGLSNVGVWVLIIVTMLMQYNSCVYLAKYTDKVVVPTAVVQFGPYRWVRHPMYASTMFLFVTYFVALRAPLSSLFVIAVCVLYYEQKAKLEEALMLETFGGRYTEYMEKVKHKFIPFVY